MLVRLSRPEGGAPSKGTSESQRINDFQKIQISTTAACNNLPHVRDGGCDRGDFGSHLFVGFLKSLCSVLRLRVSTVAQAFPIVLLIETARDRDLAILMLSPFAGFASFGFHAGGGVIRSYNGGAVRQVRGECNAFRDMGRVPLELCNCCLEFLVHDCPRRPVVRCGHSRA